MHDATIQQWPGRQKTLRVSMAWVLVHTAAGSAEPSWNCFPTVSPLFAFVLLTGFFTFFSMAAQQEKEMGASFTQLVDLASSMVGSAFHAP
jgi:hypothetical protein